NHQHDCQTTHEEERAPQPSCPCRSHDAPVDAMLVERPVTNATRRQSKQHLDQVNQRERAVNPSPGIKRRQDELSQQLTQTEWPGRYLAWIARRALPRLYRVWRHTQVLSRADPLSPPAGSRGRRRRSLNSRLSRGRSGAADGSPLITQATP